MSNLFVVYDLRYPSPVALKEIVVNKIVIELWRQDIHKQRTEGILEEFDYEKSISSNILHPYFPPLLRDTIDKKISQVGTSIKRWVECYTKTEIFQSHVLHNFDDFVCDFDGSIDYGKTAKRMLLCDEISQIAKFKISCLCCFEDDITQRWPSVSSQFRLRDINFTKNPLLFYWICRLRNQLYKIPVQYGENLHVSVFLKIIDYSSNFRNQWSSVEYFFNRFNSNLRQNQTKKILFCLPQEFYRYVIAKLNEEEIEEILKTSGSGFWRSLEISKIWIYVKHKITANDFVILIRQIIRQSVTYEILPEIWTTAPDHFKQLAIRNVVLDKSLLKYSEEPCFAWSSYKVNFLLIVLSDVPLQDRCKFWNDNWVKFLWVMNTSELRQLMAICFENDNEIIQYKKTVMSDFGKIGDYCRFLLTGFYFEKLNGILNFCFTEEQNIRSMKLRLLNENFLFSHYCLEKADTFNKFINDAFIDIDLATEFKNQLLSRPRFVGEFQSSIYVGSLHLVRKFIETLLPSEPAMKDYKKRFLFLNFKTCLTNGSYLMKREDVDYQNFLRWCLENDDEIAQLKQSLPVDGIVEAVMRREIERMRENPEWSRGDRGPMTYHPKLIEFLKWYFVQPEAYDNFVAKYAHDEDFVSLITQTKHNVK